MEKDFKMEEDNEECLRCLLKYCPKDCFNSHVGSRIALGKLVNQMADKGIKVHIGGDRG